MAEPAAIKKFSIQAQLAEVARELALRERVYPSRVAARRMRQSEADMHIELMKSVRATLAWFETNEQLIKQRLSY